MRKSAALGLAAALIPMPFLIAGMASGSIGTPAFAGTAAADGVRVTIDIPGGPLVDKIVDVGGPSAQVSVSTLGTSTAYAAFPDPGQLVNSGPGLIVGLLAQGAYGLPPIPLPNLPVKQVDPLEVVTDANGKQSGSLGAGPYQISAHSEATSGTADATGGLDNLGGNSVAGLHSHSEVTVGADGSVTATASTTVTGVKLGPLTIGSIVSSASETLGADGKITPKSSTGISLLGINGVPLPLKLPLLDLSTSRGTAELTKLLAPVLKPLGITISFNAVTTAPGTVTAPTLTISMPFNFKGADLAGTASVTFGQTSATMAGSIIAPETTPPVVTPPSSAPTSAAVLPPSGPTPSVVTSAPSSAPVSQPVSSAPVPRTVARSSELLGVFDVKGLYLVLVALGVTLVLLSQLIRLLGVRP